MMISFEMNMDLLSVGRVGYNVIDMFSDIGGIQSIIMTTFALILSVLNHNHFDSYMAQQLYKLTSLKSSSPTKEDKTDYFRPSKYANSKEFLIDALPKRWVCCRKSRH